MEPRIKASFNKQLQLIEYFPKRELDRFLQLGIRSFYLVGVPIEQHSLSNGILMYVEDDLELLLEYANNAEEFVADQSVKSQHATLSDGGLVIVADKDVSTIIMDFTYYPGLDIENKVSNKIKVTKPEYISWWRSLSEEILNT